MKRRANNNCSSFSLTSLFVIFLFPADPFDFPGMKTHFSCRENLLFMPRKWDSDAGAYRKKGKGACKVMFAHTQTYARVYSNVCSPWLKIKPFLNSGFSAIRRYLCTPSAASTNLPTCYSFVHRFCNRTPLFCQKIWKFRIFSLYLHTKSEL
jgi:hypothetical protein